MHKHSWTYLTCALLLFMVLPCPAAQQNHDQIQKKSFSFLELLDKSQYENAWEMMTPLFQLLNEQQQWQTRQKAIRGAYGTSESRNVRRTTHRKTYPNSPDGDYVVIQFDTVFSHKQKAIETVVFNCRTDSECAIREYIIN